MKKFLSVMLALLMIVSVMTLAGCKKGGGNTEPKTKAELFAGALEQLMLPKLVDSFVDLDFVKNANSFRFAVDELSISALTDMETAEMPTLPNFAFDFSKIDGDYFTVGAEVTLDDEVLSGTVVIDGETVYASVPEASDLYVTGTFDELLELAMVTPYEDTESVKSVITSIIGAFEGLSDELLNDDYLMSESVDVEVFGEEVALNKITFELDENDIVALAEEFYDKLPEDMKDGEEFDPEIPEGTEFSLALSVYLDGETLNKFEIDADIKAEGESVKMTAAYDVANTASAYKVDGELEMEMNGEKLMTMETKGEVTLEDGKLDGKIKSKPEFNLPEEAADASVLAIIEDIEFVAEYEGELKDDAFEIEMENEISLGGMAIKIPTTVKGEISDDEIALDIDMELTLMGAGFKVGFTAVTADKDLEKAEFDADDAVSLDDHEKLEEFGEEVAYYIEGLEKLSALFASAEPEYDTGYGDAFGEDYDDIFGDEDYSPTLFNIYNDTEDIYFFENGTGVTSTECELDADIAAGKFTLTSPDGSSTVLTLTGIDTAESEGLEFTYDMYEFDDGDVDYYFHLDELGIDVSAHPYDDVAYIETPFTYTMDDTTITIGTTEMEYTIDEDAGTMTLGNEVYDYISYEE